METLCGAIPNVSLIFLYIERFVHNTRLLGKSADENVQDIHYRSLDMS